MASISARTSGVKGFAIFSTLGYGGLRRKFLSLRLGHCRPFRLDFVAQNRHPVGRFRTWQFRFDGERGKFSKNVGLRQLHEETGCLRLGHAEANQFRNFEPHPIGC